MLNAHAAAVARFRELVPEGMISLNLNSDWAEPATSSKKDKASTALTNCCKVAEQRSCCPCPPLECISVSIPPRVQEAAQRHLDFSLGIYADPVFKGDYPASVRQRVKGLPAFTPEQQKLLLASADYFAL